MSKLQWIFVAALLGSALPEFPQAMPTVVPIQTLQAGETLTVEEEITTTTNTSLQVSGGTLGEGTAGGTFTPPTNKTEVHTHQTIQIVSIDATANTISVTTPGIEVVAADQQPPTTNYKLTCHASSHFDQTALEPTADNDAVLQETCEMLERINGTAAFLNKVRAASLIDLSNGSHVLLPIVANPPEGTWTLTLNPAAAAANVFDVVIKDTDPTIPSWTGSLQTNNSDDEVTITLKSQTTGPMADKAPNGDVVNATVKTVVTWHRIVTRQVPPPAQPTPS